MYITVHIIKLHFLIIKLKTSIKIFHHFYYCLKFLSGIAKLPCNFIQNFTLLEN